MVIEDWGTLLDLQLSDKSNLRQDREKPPHTQQNEEKRQAKEQKAVISYLAHGQISRG